MSADTQPVPLSVFTGTKAQFIKLAPVIQEFARRGWTYRLIDTGQHAALTRHIVEDFGIRPPDICLWRDPRGVDTMGSGLRWTASMTRILLRTRATIRRELFEGRRGLSFVHGDTASTLLSTLIAKRAGQQVAHVEAGLRSYRWLHPFPEEIIRIAVMRMADLLFAPSAVACQNLERMGLSDRTVPLPGNTNMDTMANSLSREPRFPSDLRRPFSLVTVHRIETIYSRASLEKVVDVVLQAHSAVPAIFVLHPPTKRRLTATGHDSVLAEAGVRFLPLVEHATFAHLLKDAEFVVTDGGSVQEEAAYTGTPCLVLREATERDDGLGDNAVLGTLDLSRAQEFLSCFRDYRKPSRLGRFDSPSVAIANHVASRYR